MGHEISPEPNEPDELAEVADDAPIEFDDTLPRAAIHYFSTRVFNPNGGELNDPRDIANGGDW